MWLPGQLPINGTVHIVFEIETSSVSLSIPELDGTSTSGRLDSTSLYKDYSLYIGCCTFQSYGRLIILSRTSTPCYLLFDQGAGGGGFQLKA